MKTSKKLLSLFLALVMIITSCSIGFTAFAADGNKTDENSKYWSDGTNAEAAFDSLNDLVDTYIPELLNIPAIKNLLQDNLGMTVTKTTTISDVVAGASPLLLGLLGGGADKGAIRGDSSAMADIYFSYLEDDDAVMDFYALYKFCTDNQDSSDADIKAYCQKTLPELQALLDLYKDTKSNYEDARDYGQELLEDGKYADALADIDFGEATLEDIENVEVEGTKLKDIKDPELDTFIKYVNGLLQGVQSPSTATNPAEAVYYLFSEYGTISLIAEIYLGMANLGGAKITAEEYGDESGTALTVQNYREILGNLLTLDLWAEFNGVDGDLEDIRQRIEDGDASAQDELDELTAEYNKTKGIMIPILLYQLILPEDNGYETFDSPYYKEMITGTLLYAGAYTQEEIESYYLTKDQIVAYCEYAGKIKDFSYNQFVDYLNSGECAFSKPVSQYLLHIANYSWNSSGDAQMAVFVNAGRDNNPEAIYNFSYDTKWKFNHGKTFIQHVNDMVPSELSIMTFGNSTISGTTDANDPLSCYMLYNEFATSVAPALKNAKYDYSNYEIPGNLVVKVVNAKLNGILGEYLAPGAMIAGIIDINAIINTLLESNITLYSGDGKGALDDLWINLYNQPVETIFKLLPVLTIFIDELVLPLVLNDEDDASLIDLYAMLCTGDGILAGLTQDAGSNIGIGALNFDLNKIVPAILHWLIGDEATTYSIVGHYEGDVYDNSVPKFTNIYIADNLLYGVKIGNGDVNTSGLARTMYRAIAMQKDDDGNYSYKGDYAEQTSADATAEQVKAEQERVAEKREQARKIAVGVDEAVTEIASFASDAIDEYLAGHKSDPRYGNDTDITVIQKGLNNLFVALPQVLDIMGQHFISKYDVDSDWKYTYDGKITTITKTFTDGTVEQLQNATLQAFKDTSSTGDPNQVLDKFVDILIGNWINGILDLVNDVISDDSNDITSNLAIVQGLLEALGGLGEKSIITDLVNGLFQLKRCDKASFTLEKREKTNFVGFSNESGFFLLSNIQFEKGGKNHGLVPFIMELINGSDSKAKYNVNNAFAKATTKSPLLANSKSAAGTDYSKLLTKKNEKAAQKLIDALDELLSSLLANTSLNGFDWDSTDNLLSSLVTFASAYLGGKNTSDIILLLNNYLYYVSGESKASPSKKGQIGTKPTSSGDVDKSKIYTSANLSNLVIQTYSLVENIVDYLFYNGESGFLRERDTNMLLGDALYGIISPDAVAVRLTDYDKTAEILKDKDFLNWNSFKVQIAAANTKSSSWKKDYLKFGFSNGDKEAFYDALGQSLSGIASILSVVLTKTYTDAAKSGNYYSEIVYPVLKSLADANGVSGVMSVSAFNAATAPEQLIKGIITPVSNILGTIYDAPVTMLLNTVKGLAKILQDSYVKKIVNGAINPINNLLSGAINIVEFLSPTLASFIEDLIGSGINISLPKKNIIVSLLNSLIGNIIKLPNIDWTKLATAKSPAQVLLLVYGYLVDTILNSKLIQDLIKSVAPDLLDIIKNLSATQILDILSKVIAVVQSPTEIYWTFSEYASRLYRSFSYPRNILPAEASKAVGQLDDLVANVFPLLNGLGITDIESLSALVNDKLYTNGILTSALKGIYGLFDKEIDKASHLTIGAILKDIGIDVSPAGMATYLTDKEYGKTYSSVAKSLRKAKKWDKVGDLNWGFTDGSAKAQTGFVNGLAAIFRPFNDILAVFLAEGKLNLKDVRLDKVISELSLSGKTNLGSGETGCTLKYALKDGVLTLTVRSNVKTTNNKDNVPSVLKVDLKKILEDLKDPKNPTVLNFGTNGFESAIIPILEAFMCKNVKTYKQYKSDYAKAKDNLLLDVLKPILGFVDDVLEAPFDTVSAVLPNVAYFIDSNGVAQAVGNLLAPITAKNGVLGVLDKNGLNVDKLIKIIAGKSLGKIITDKLGIKTNLNFQLTHLEKCNIQEIVVPLVNKILKDKKLGIVVPAIDFGKLASHGTLKTVASKAKNSQGKYTTRRVISYQGETLVAVLRFVADTLIKNAYGIRDLLCKIDGIKKNETISNILKCVFNQLAVAQKDDIVRAVFYFLTERATDSFFDYSNFKYDDSYEFSFGDMDEDFCRQLAPMLDGLITGLIDLNGLITEKVYTDEIVSKLATGLYGAIEGVKISDKIGSLTHLLSMTDIDFTTGNVAKLLEDKAYGKTYPSNAEVIRHAGAWDKVKAEDLSWGVKDRDSFLNALCAVLRPIYGVLDVLLNDASLNLFDLVKIPGSDGYTSTIVPLMEAFECYNLKTQYQYREDIFEAYDNILLDILNPLLDKVEDILAAPIEMVADILPNLSLFFANDGLLQIVNNLLTPVSALLEAIRPIVDINQLLLALKLNVPELLAKLGIKVDINFDIYDLPKTLMPLVGAENVVGFLNQVLGIIKIKGTALGLELPGIDWFQLASHGEFITDEASQVASFGKRIYVVSDQDETLIAVLRYLINTINYKGNYQAIVDLISGLLGDGVSDSVSDIISQVLGMLQGDADEVLMSLVDLLQSLA